MIGSLEVTCTNVGPTRFCGEARGHQAYCDVITDMGGEDSAMLPPESLLASLGNCLGMVVALTCRNKEIPYEGMCVNVTADMVEGGKRLDNFRAAVTMPEALDDRQRKIVESAIDLCKVGKTIAHGAQVEEVIL